MAKQSGLGGNVYVNGYDLSGDVSALGRIAGGPAALDGNGVNNSAVERLAGLLTGEISFQTFFNAAALQEHVALSALPTSDVQLAYFVGTTLGDPVAAMISKQIGYDPTRGADGALLFAVQALSTGTKVGLEWCRSLTAGKRTDTGATNGSSVNDGSQAAAVTIATSSIANPTVITTTTPHGLVTGDSVIIADHTSVTPALDGEYEVTVTGASTFTVPVNVTADGVDGTVTKTSTNFGLSGYLQAFSLTGTSMTATIQHSPDGTTWAAVTGGAFAAVTGRATERIATSSTRTIQKYLRLATTGTFNPCAFAVAYNRHLTATL